VKKEHTRYPRVSHAETPLCPALGALPKVVLSHGPTPVEQLANLGGALGIDLWAKRDDCNGLAMGGNKVRQLEYYFGAAAVQQADTVLVTGALQSNFVRLTAAAARKVGWHPEVQLEARVSRDDVFYKQSGNVLLDQLLGATIHHIDCGDNEQAADASLDRIAAALGNAGKRPYVIHLAASHPPIGALGYVEAAIETYNQLQAANVDIDRVVIPSGSGLTHAGFLVGARLIGWTVPVQGICVRRDASAQHQRICQRTEQLCELMGVAR
jgi:D-cysteine desulfhydrase/L-cysteate sulfo-lyase